METEEWANSLETMNRWKFLVTTNRIRQQSFNVSSSMVGWIILGQFINQEGKREEVNQSKEKIQAMHLTFQRIQIQRENRKSSFRGRERERETGGVRPTGLGLRNWVDGKWSRLRTYKPDEKENATPVDSSILYFRKETCQFTFFWEDVSSFNSFFLGKKTDFYFEFNTYIFQLVFKCFSSFIMYPED